MARNHESAVISPAPFIFYSCSERRLRDFLIIRLLKLSFIKMNDDIYLGISLSSVYNLNKRKKQILCINFEVGFRVDRRDCSIDSKSIFG